jgi:hypothetical protein
MVMRPNMLTRLYSDIYRVDEVLARTFNMVGSFRTSMPLVMPY